MKKLPIPKSVQETMEKLLNPKPIIKLRSLNWEQIVLLATLRGDLDALLTSINSIIDFNHIEGSKLITVGLPCRLAGHEKDRVWIDFASYEKPCCLGIKITMKHTLINEVRAALMFSSASKILKKNRVLHDEVLDRNEFTYKRNQKHFKRYIDNKYYRGELNIGIVKQYSNLDNIIYIEIVSYIDDDDLSDYNFPGEQKKYLHNFIANQSGVYFSQSIMYGEANTICPQCMKLKSINLNAENLFLENRCENCGFSYYIEID